MLAGVVMPNKSSSNSSRTSSSSSPGGGVAAVGAPTSAPRCAACVRIGREECRLCTRWSDSRGDCSVRRCGGRSAGATAGQAPDAALLSASPPRRHGDRVDRKLLL
ncbi:Os09g0317500 [Oryza sativa Japonica Group]|uniref:Os09g0317500 protein n=1 Tax=Oryza sativa subsp. japonica TaxID=39947 RepID=A0A0P0XJX5_ORYSJ|nr:Os09g0317500 [Oryza sativa Japonica Group]